MPRTLDHPPYVGLEVFSLIVAFLVKTAPVKVIIPLSNRLSIVSMRCPKPVGMVTIIGHILALSCGRIR